MVSREIEFYNLDVIISVGYRVKSHRGTQFRIWATQRLREYIVKGFTLDDERLKRAGAGNYFDELLARIRDIRSSERLFWKKVLEIYATSIDYDPNVESSRLLFKTVQNKMHWAAHGHTAAEIIAARADATRPNMGLTSWTGPTPRKPEVAIAKNYLATDELDPQPDRQRIPRVRRTAGPEPQADVHGRLDLEARRFPAPLRAKDPPARRQDLARRCRGEGRTRVRPLLRASCRDAVARGDALRGCRTGGQAAREEATTEVQGAQQEVVTVKR